MHFYFFKFLFISFEKDSVEKDCSLRSVLRKDSITFRFIHTSLFPFSTFIYKEAKLKVQSEKLESHFIQYSSTRCEAYFSSAIEQVRFWFDLLVIRSITESEKMSGPFDRQRRTCINFYSYHKAGKSVVVKCGAGKNVSGAIGPSHAQMSIS